MRILLIIQSNLYIQIQIQTPVRSKLKIKMHFGKVRKPYLDRKNTIYIFRSENKIKKSGKKNQEKPPHPTDSKWGGIFLWGRFFCEQGRMHGPLRPPLSDIYLHRAIYSEGLITGPGPPENPDLDSEWWAGPAPGVPRDFRPRPCANPFTADGYEDKRVRNLEMFAAFYFIFVWFIFGFLDWFGFVESMNAGIELFYFVRM